ncbi:MAG TPA: response regulator [Candidatus Sumerlaeota bacterium]|nr:response regulator [Candidatus Sumerlaeota bacterium]
MAFDQLSSYQIGKMLDVSRQAVNQWIDKGYIPSYRTPGGHRRVRREDFINFLNSRQIPIPDILQRAIDQERRSAAPRIILVDDDAEFLAVLRQAIQEQLPEARIEAYESGYDALVAIGQGLPDLLVLDIKMPKIDGVEVCRRLKRNDATRRLPVMIVSAHDTPEWRESLQALKVQAIFSKGEPLLEIARQIRQFIETKAATLKI